MNRQVAVVQRVGVAAVGIDYHGAIVALDACATHITCHIGIAATSVATLGNACDGGTICTHGVLACVASACACDDVASDGRRGVFIDAVDIIGGRGLVVHDLDGDRCIRIVTITVLGNDGEGVTGVSARNVGRHCQGVGVVKRDAAVRCLGIALEVELAVLRLHALVGRSQCFNLGFGQHQGCGLTITADVADGDARSGVQAVQRHELDGGVHQNVVGVGLAAIVQAAFKHHQILGVAIGRGGSVGGRWRNGHGHAIVLSMDGDGQRGCRGVAISIFDGVGIGFGEGFTGLEALNRQVGVVQYVAVAAVGIEYQCAIAACDA